MACLQAVGRPRLPSKAWADYAALARVELRMGREGRSGHVCRVVAEGVAPAAPHHTPAVVGQRGEAAPQWRDVLTEAGRRDHEV